MGSSRKHKKDRDVVASSTMASSSSSNPKKHKHKKRENSQPIQIIDDDEYSNGRSKDRSTRKHKKHHKEHKQRKHKRRSSSPIKSLQGATAADDRYTIVVHDDYHSDSSDVIEVPIAPPAPTISKSSSKPSSSSNNTSSDTSFKSSKPPSGILQAPPAPIISNFRSTNSKRPSSRSPSPIPANGVGDCLSIEDTNKLRAKLGLKPLEINNSVSKNDSESSTSKPSGGETHSKHKDEWGEFYHKPAVNIAEKIEAEKLREKFRQRKEKRLIEDKLKTVKSLGELDDFDDITAWVDRTREKERLKAEADKRAKLLEEMDDAFGVNELVKQDLQETKRLSYTNRNLRGLKVGHDIDSFGEGKTVILTLKDRDVLNETDEETLVNVNMEDNERYKKNVENKKMDPNNYGYNVYDEQVDEFGQLVTKNVLSKYDEEIDGRKQSSFTIGENLDEERASKRRLLEIKTKLAGKKLETLDEPMVRIASDVFTDEEMSKFKKPKRKVKKLRQKLKADDLLINAGNEKFDQNDFGRRNYHQTQQKINASNYLDTDDLPEMKHDLTDVKFEEEDNDLERALSKVRRIKQKEAIISKPMPIEPIKIKDEIKNENSEMDEDDDDNDNKSYIKKDHSGGGGDIAAGINGQPKDSNYITLNATAEFCRTLGDIPTYGMSGNRDEDAGDMMDFEEQIEEYDDPKSDNESIGGTWNSVNPDIQIISDDNKSNDMIEVAILDEEPDVSSSMGAALKLAMSKGYLEREETNRPSTTRMAHLQAKNYSIEDKAYGEDEKFNRRDRYHSGPISDFREKDGYKPNVKLEYIDDNGRILNEKEAFRYLSHKFHGKGPGKNKIQKRLKKSEQDGLLMKMSSTDTPLGTLTMLQHKQKETHSPYIVLSGSKQTHASTSITKHK